MPVTNVPCAICGMTPTLRLTIRRHVGLILVQQFASVNKPLCRTHGRQMTKTFLKKTLWQGWWGLFSFFMNIFDVCSDLSALRKFNELSEPAPPYANVVVAAARTPLPSAPLVAPGACWQRDPYQRHHYRWYDGKTWSDSVSTNGVNSTDPVGWR